MAVHHPASPPQGEAVVGGHWIAVAGVEIIHPQAIATVLLARTVEIPTAPQVKAHMGAALWRAEEDQIPRLQQAGLAGLHGDGPAEALLQIGIPGQPDSCVGKGRLQQARAIKIGAEGAAPEVAVRHGHGLLGKGEHGGDGGFDRWAIPGPGKRRVGHPLPVTKEIAEMEPAGVTILQEAHP